MLCDDDRLLKFTHIHIHPHKSRTFQCLHQRYAYLCGGWFMYKITQTHSMRLMRWQSRRAIIRSYTICHAENTPIKKTYNKYYVVDWLVISRGEVVSFFRCSLFLFVSWFCCARLIKTLKINIHIFFAVVAGCVVLAFIIIITLHLFNSWHSALSLFLSLPRSSTCNILSNIFKHFAYNKSFLNSFFVVGGH